MARENVIADVRSIDDAGEFRDDAGTSGCLDIDCPSCDRRFTFGEWARQARGERVEPSCPTCDGSFSVRVGTEFALVERDGWAVSVSVGREEPRR